MRRLCQPGNAGQASRSQACNSNKSEQANGTAGEREVKRPGLRIHRQLPGAQPERVGGQPTDENPFARVLKAGGASLVFTIRVTAPGLAALRPM